MADREQLVQEIGQLIDERNEIQYLLDSNTALSDDIWTLRNDLRTILKRIDEIKLALED